MPYYSTFWDRHYKDIGNCCMTFPLEDIKLDYKKTQYTAADCMDVGWMKDKRLKWFGWDNNGNTSWTAPDGMIYHVKDLKRNELGEAYEKEVDEIRDVPMEDPSKGFDSKRDFYEYEVEAQSKCQFCRRGGVSGDRGGGKDIEDKDSSSFGSGPEKVNTDWQQYAQGNSDPTNVINNEYVKEPQKYAGGPYGPPDGYSNPYLPSGPSAPPPPGVPPYGSPPYMSTTPPGIPPSDAPPTKHTRTPPVINPVAHKAAVLHDPDVLTSPPGFFERQKKKPGNPFDFNNPQEKKKDNEKDCPKKGGLYIPIRQGKDPKNSEEFRVLQEIAGKLAGQISVEPDGHIIVPTLTDSEAQIEVGTLNAHWGYTLLRDIANNSERIDNKPVRIQFSVANSLIGRDRDTGQRVEYPIYNGKNVKMKLIPGGFTFEPNKGDMNFSKTPRRDSPTRNTPLAKDLWNKANAKPEECFEGTIAIPLDVKGLKDAGEDSDIYSATDKSQASLALHGLAEVFYRTIKPLSTFDDAHNYAIDFARKLATNHPAYSKFPGSYGIDEKVLLKYQNKKTLYE